MNENATPSETPNKPDSGPREEKRVYWAGMVDRWQRSGLSKAAFCQREGIPQWKFYYWFKRQCEENTSEGTGGFIKVEPKNTTTNIQLRFPNGMEVELAPDFDERTVKRLLSLVAELC